MCKIQIWRSLLFFMGFILCYQSGWGANPPSSRIPARPRGVDFRLSFDSGQLDFTNISGVKRKFIGVGSDLQTSLYVVETGALRMNLLINSRIMSWTGQNTQAGEHDHMFTFSFSPGAEIHIGPLYFQTIYQKMNANSYFVSSYSQGKQFLLEGTSYSGGLLFKLKHLGIGLSAFKMKFNVPLETLNLSESVVYDETTYQFNLIYFIDETVLKFFKDL